jgi:hypothetical protein
LLQHNPPRKDTVIDQLRYNHFTGDIEMSSMQTISIQVSPAAAKAYHNASAPERKKMELLLSLRLLEVSRSRKPLEAVMREISRSAQERGLTPDLLDDLLKD